MTEPYAPPAIKLPPVKPPHASKHCRHYSYNLGAPGLGFRDPDSGPKCAAGILFGAGVGTGPCMPGPVGVCYSRAEYTAAEHAAWAEWRAGSDARFTAAYKSIAPGSIALNTTTKSQCPNCNGWLTISRASNGHVWIQCATPHCVGPIHLAIDRARAWPLEPKGKLK